MNFAGYVKKILPFMMTGHPEAAGIYALYVMVYGTSWLGIRRLDTRRYVRNHIYVPFFSFREPSRGTAIRNPAARISP